MNIEVDIKKLPDDLTLLEFIVLSAVADNTEAFTTSYELANSREPVGYEGDLLHVLLALQAKLYIKVEEDKYFLRKKTTDLFPEENDVSFDSFWNEYHKISGTPKSDKEAAYKHWRRLRKFERNKAFEKIQEYVTSVRDKRFIKKARTYLSDKNFNDEFINGRDPNQGSVTQFA